jgi:hypothetical protein
VTVAAVLRGGHQTYPISLGVNALCAIEELTGLPWAQVVREIRHKRPKRDVVHGFLRAVLVNGTDLESAAVTRILRDIGGVRILQAAMKGVW